MSLFSHRTTAHVPHNVGHFRFQAMRRQPSSLQKSKTGRRWSLVSSLLLSLLLVTTTVVAAAAVGEARSSSNGIASRCGDILLLGARASGQSMDEGYGAGPQVQLAIDEFRSETRGYRKVIVAVPYPALRAQPVAFFTSSRYVSEYFASIDAGVAQTLHILRTRQLVCPSERIVVLGASQGAMVMHRTIAQLLQGDMHILSRLDAAILIGDGDRYADPEMLHLGTAPANDARGISMSFPFIRAGHEYGPLNQNISSISDWDPSRLIDVCMQDDIVCDPGPLSVFHIDEGIAVHTQGYVGGGAGVPYIRQAAHIAVNRIEGM